MNQEETGEKSSSDETTTASPQENLNAEEIAADLSEQEDSEEVDNLPIESIGSYGRIEPLVNENTEYPEETDSER
jgi:nucleosome binding factor SPN SPT16 subunit